MLKIAKRQALTLNLLIMLMALTGDQHRIPAFGLRNSHGNSGRAVNFNQRRAALATTSYVINNLLGRFGPRVITGNDHSIGQSAGDHAHLGPLPFVSVSATTKDHPKHAVLF